MSKTPATTRPRTGCFERPVGSMDAPPPAAVERPRIRRLHPAGSGHVAATTLFGRVRYLMWWGLVAAFLYFAMAPAVDWLVRKGTQAGPGHRCGDAGADRQRAGLLIAMTPLIVSETETMIADVPGMINNLKDFAGRFGVDVNALDTGQQAQSALTALQGHLPDLAGGALSLTSALLGGLFEFFVILLFTFFLLANQDTFRRFLLS